MTAKKMTRAEASDELHRLNREQMAEEDELSVEPTVVVHDYDPVRPKGEKKPKASDDEGGE